LSQGPHGPSPRQTECRSAPAPAAPRAALLYRELHSRASAPPRREVYAPGMKQAAPPCVAGPAEAIFTDPSPLNACWRPATGRGTAARPRLRAATPRRACPPLLTRTRRRPPSRPPRLTPFPPARHRGAALVPPRLGIASPPGAVPCGRPSPPAPPLAHSFPRARRPRPPPPGCPRAPISSRVKPTALPAALSPRPRPPPAPAPKARPHPVPPHPQTFRALPGPRPAHARAARPPRRVKRAPARAHCRNGMHDAPSPARPPSSACPPIAPPGPPQCAPRRGPSAPRRALPALGARPRNVIPCLRRSLGLRPSRLGMGDGDGRECGQPGWPRASASPAPPRAASAPCGRGRGAPHVLHAGRRGAGGPARRASPRGGGGGGGRARRGHTSGECRAAPRAAPHLTPAATADPTLRTARPAPTRAPLPPFSTYPPAVSGDHRPPAARSGTQHARP
jgi:hypothetical protein